MKNQQSTPPRPPLAAMTCSAGLCETCRHRADSIANVTRWRSKGARGMPCDPAPKVECKEHEGYGLSGSRKFCEDYKAEPKGSATGGAPVNTDTRISMPVPEVALHPFVRDSDGFWRCPVCHGTGISPGESPKWQRPCGCCKGEGYHAPEPYRDPNPYPMR